MGRSAGSSKAIGAPTTGCSAVTVDSGAAAGSVVVVVTTGSVIVTDLAVAAGAGEEASVEVCSAGDSAPGAVLLRSSARPPSGMAASITARAVPASHGWERRRVMGGSPLNDGAGR